MNTRSADCGIAELAELFEAEKKDRAVGIVKFIGQLCLKAFFTPVRLGQIIALLVRRSALPEEHYVECFCILVQTVGAHFESSQQGKSDMQDFANRMKNLAALYDYSMRIKLKLEDVLELRESNWKGILLWVHVT